MLLRTESIFLSRVSFTQPLFPTLNLSLIFPMFSSIPSSLLNLSLLAISSVSPIIPIFLLTSHLSIYCSPVLLLDIAEYLHMFRVDGLPVAKQRTRAAVDKPFVSHVTEHEPL